jgi:hypothetical protein
MLYGLRLTRLSVDQDGAVGEPAGLIGHPPPDLAGRTARHLPNSTTVGSACCQLRDCLIGRHKNETLVRNIDMTSV